MERQHGPSNRLKTNLLKSIRQQQTRIYELFGTDSESEDIEANSRIDLNATQLQEVCDATDSDDDDVLELATDNADFNTPIKEQQEKLPVTPKESLTPTVKRIFKQAIQTCIPLSPLPKTPVRNVYLHKDILNVTVAYTHTSSFQRTPASHAGTFTEQDKVQNTTHTQTHAHNSNHIHSLQRFIHANASTQSPQTNKQQSFDRVILAHERKAKPLTQPSCETTHKDKKQNNRIHPYTRIQNAHSVNQSASQSRTHKHTNKHSLDSITRTITQVHPSHSHSHSVTSATITQTKIQPKQTHTQANAHISTNQLITNTKKQIAVESKSAPHSKTLNLKNKYVPNGVQLSIAVGHNKTLSKNAKKKITRNLISQL